jgi:hypothetical protein
VLHPCFYTAHAERGDHGDLLGEVYFSAYQIDQRFNVAGIESPGEIHMNFRSLEYYMSLLTDSGYVVTHLSEPHPTPEQLRQEWWRKSFVKPLSSTDPTSKERTHLWFCWSLQTCGRRSSRCVPRPPWEGTHDASYDCLVPDDG